VYQQLEINARENRRGNQQLTIQRYWQYWVHKTLDEDKQNKKLSSEAKRKRNTKKPERLLIPNTKEQ
jgi:hypothetical protein